MKLKEKFSNFTKLFQIKPRLNLSILQKGIEQRIPSNVRGMKVIKNCNF